MYALVQSQAAVLSYVEVYWLLAVASAVMFVASFVPPGTTSVNGNSSNYGTNTGTTTPSTIGVLSLQNLSHLNSCDTSVTLPNFTANALLNDSTTRIIQNPELRSVDGQAAKLNIGDRVPVATGSFQAGVGVGSSSAAGFVSPLVNTQFQYIDVGTNVEITPRVHPNHEVSLKISVEVSAVTNQANIGGIQQPIISQRKVIHDIRLTEGESSVLCVNQTRREQAVRAPSWAS
jgi:general secretion pathway protein D